MFVSGLDASRPLAEREAIVDDMYGRYEAEVAKDPAAHAMDYVSTVRSREGRGREGGGLARLRMND